MGFLMVVAWFVAAAASATLAGRAWRRTRPMQTIRLTDAFGRPYECSRWILWLPLALVGLAGAFLTRSVLVKGAPAPGFCLFFLVWLAGLTLMTKVLADKASKPQEPR